MWACGAGAAALQPLCLMAGVVAILQAPGSTEAQDKLPLQAGTGVGAVALQTPRSSWPEWWLRTTGSQQQVSSSQ